MDVWCLCVALTALLYAVFSSQTGVSGVEVELRVRPGDNVTLHCDCTSSSGIYIEWYRNCSHRNQPTLVMSTYYRHKALADSYSAQYDNIRSPFPGFTLEWNKPNSTYDLLIVNVTESDLGLYYCGTMENSMEDGMKLKLKRLYHYGNVSTRLLFDVTGDPDNLQCVGGDSGCELCWKLLLTLCPGCALLSSILSSTLVYHFFCRTVSSRKDLKEPQRNLKTVARRRASRMEVEGDVCYAALDIPQKKTQPQRKRTPTSDFSTYAAVALQK